VEKTAEVVASRNTERVPSLFTECFRSLPKIIHSIVHRSLDSYSLKVNKSTELSGLNNCFSIYNQKECSFRPIFESSIIFSYSFYSIRPTLE